MLGGGLRPSTNRLPTSPAMTQPLHTHTPKHRIALLSDPTRDWKFHPLVAQLPPHYTADILTTDLLLSGSLSPSDLASYNLIFIKTKDDPALHWLRAVERLGTRLVNTLDAISASKDRFRSLDLAAAAQVPVPAHYFGPLKDIPFSRFVVKSPQDDDDDKTPIAILSPSQPAALLDHLDPQAAVYAQEYVETTWEFKIYSVGSELFGFYQHPILVNPNKHHSRQPLEVSPLLADLTRRTLQAVGLEVGGVDFLGSPTEPLMTDVNSTQGLQSFPQGYAALSRYFDRCLAVP